jgi:hypothetical protein
MRRMREAVTVARLSGSANLQHDSTTPTQRTSNTLVAAVVSQETSVPSTPVGLPIVWVAEVRLGHCRFHNNEFDSGRLTV